MSNDHDGFNVSNSSVSEGDYDFSRIFPLLYDAVERCQYEAIRSIIKLIEQKPDNTHLLDKLYEILKLQSDHHSKMKALDHSARMDLKECNMEKDRREFIWNAECFDPKLPGVIEALSKYAPYHRTKP